MWILCRGTSVARGILELAVNSIRQAIEGMLREQPGIHSIKVALLAERGVVEYDPKTWDAEKIISVRCLR